MRTFTEWLENHLTITPETNCFDVLGVRGRNLCQQLGINTLRDLSNWSVKELESKPEAKIALNQETISHMSSLLNQAGLDFKPENEDQKRASWLNQPTL